MNKLNIPLILEESWQDCIDDGYTNLPIDSSIIKSQTDALMSNIKILIQTKKYYPGEDNNTMKTAKQTAHTPTAIDVERPFPPTLAEFRMLNNELKLLNNSHTALVERVSKLEVIERADQIAIDALKFNNAELVEALDGLKRYLISVEHLLPETQDRDEVVNYMEQVLENNRG